MSKGGYINVPSDNYEVEAAPGIPSPLPKGEEVLWQGSPEWLSLAIRAFHIRKIAIYFAVLMLWRLISSRSDGASFAGAAGYAVMLVPVALAAIGVLVIIARAYARTTIYTITTRRVLIRSGVAMPITVNLPFKQIDGAGLRLHADGTGDMPLKLSRRDRLAVLAIWPHMRPWRLTRPEPMLRSVSNASGVADILSAALTGSRIPALRPDEAAPSPLQAQATGLHSAIRA